MPESLFDYQSEAFAHFIGGLTASASFALINKNGQYLVQIGFMGKSDQYTLGDICYPVTTFGHVLSLEVCTRKLVFAKDGVTPKSLTLSVKACIGKWGLSECKDLFSQTIRF